MGKFRYNYISGDPGSGKTELAIRRIQKFVALHENVLMVVPTIRLCNEIQNRSNGVIQAIHSENSSIGDTQNRIQEIMRNTRQNGTALVITDSSFMNMRYRSNANNWVVFKDEPKEPLTIVDLAVPDSLDFILRELLDLRESVTHGLLHTAGLQLTQNWKFTSMDDAVFKELAQLQHYLSNSTYFEVLIDAESLKDQRLKYSVFQKPELYEDFAEVYFMGANFEHLFIYDQWQRRGVTWVNKTPSYIPKMPTDRLHIHYFTDKYSWSAYARGLAWNSKQTVLDAYLAWLTTTIPHNNYVYVANNGYSDQQLNLSGQRMPAECHGLNAYRHITDVALIGSYLVNKSLEPFYNYYGSSSSDVRGQRQTQYYVQQLTRTNIRVYSGTDAVHAYVPTLDVALSLLTYFTEAKLIPPELNRIGLLNPTWRPDIIDADVPVTESPAIYGSRATQLIPDYLADLAQLFFDDTPKSATERSRKHRANKKIPGLNDINDHSDATIGAFIAGNNIYRTTTILAPIVAGHPVFNDFNDLISSGHLHLRFVVFQASEFSCPNNESMTKDELKQLKNNRMTWFSCGIYEPGKNLTRTNCLGAKMIGFDLDGTTITDTQISRVMKEWEYLQYTTISHKSNQPTRRLRIIAPYDRPVTLEEHDRIKQYFFRVLNQVNTATLALDEAKTDPWAKLFAPHAEAEIIWSKIKSKHKTKPIPVDWILAQQPRSPRIQPPSVEDIQWHYETSYAQTQANDKYIQTRLDEIQTLLDSMTAGDRSIKAVKIGGKLKRVPEEYHNDIFAQMTSRGVEREAIQQAKKYSKLN